MFSGRKESLPHSFWRISFNTRLLTETFIKNIH